MKISTSLSILLCSLCIFSYAQNNTFKTYPDQNWIIRPQVGVGYTFGKQEKGQAYHYGARILYSARRMFLGGTVMFGGEYMILDAHETTDNLSNPLDESRAKYLVLAPMFEQNYKVLKNSLSMTTGVGYYIGIQSSQQNAVGLITNLAWSPLTSMMRIKPYISYRNDWLFNENQTQTHSISIGFSL